MTKRSLQDLSVADCDWQKLPAEVAQLPLTRLQLRFADFGNGGRWVEVSCHPKFVNLFASFIQSWQSAHRRLRVLYCYLPAIGALPPRSPTIPGWPA